MIASRFFRRPISWFYRVFSFLLAWSTHILVVVILISYSNAKYYCVAEQSRNKRADQWLVLLSCLFIYVCHKNNFLLSCVSVSRRLLSWFHEFVIGISSAEMSVGQPSVWRPGLLSKCHKNKTKKNRILYFFSAKKRNYQIFRQKRTVASQTIQRTVASQTSEQTTIVSQNKIPVRDLN